MTFLRVRVQEFKTWPGFYGPPRISTAECVTSAGLQTAVEGTGQVVNTLPPPSDMN